MHERYVRGARVWNDVRGCARMVPPCIMDAMHTMHRTMNDVPPVMPLSCSPAMPPVMAPCRALPPCPCHAPLSCPASMPPAMPPCRALPPAMPPTCVPRRAFLPSPPSAMPLSYLPRRAFLCAFLSCSQPAKLNSLARTIVHHCCARTDLPQSSP